MTRFDSSASEPPRPAGSEPQPARPQRSWEAKPSPGSVFSPTRAAEPAPQQGVALAHQPFGQVPPRPQVRVERAEVAPARRVALQGGRGGERGGEGERRVSNREVDLWSYITRVNREVVYYYHYHHHQ